MTQTIDYLAEKDAFLSVYVNYAADKRIVFNTETHAFEWKKNTINDDEVQYMSEWNQCWYAWKHCVESKVNAVTENTKTVYLVWNKSHSECVGFDDKQDAKYASTGRQTSLGYSSLAGEFREVYEDEIGEGNFDITEIKIQSQEPSHD